MVLVRAGKPEEPDPNPQSCNIFCSQVKKGGHQGCLGHFQEGQKGQYQVDRAQVGHPEDFHNFSVVDLPLVKSIDGLSVISFQSFHGILAH